MKQIQTVAIYFSDLSKERQDELLKLFRVSSPDEMNWGLYPVSLIEEPEHDEGLNTQPE